jgi:hypothetical protein
VSDSFTLYVSAGTAPKISKSNQMVNKLASFLHAAMYRTCDRGGTSPHPSVRWTRLGGRRIVAMKHLIKTLLITLALPATLALTALAPSSAIAQPACVDGDVCPGYDLFQTQPGTNLDGIGFTGVPLGDFNFGPSSGGALGTYNVGLTDTIVQRLGDVTAPSGSTPIIIDALQLESTMAITTGMGTQYLFASLYGTQTAGSMTIDITTPATPTTPGSGTLLSNLPVAFQITDGSLSGHIDTSINIPGICTAGICSETFTGSGSWSSAAPAGAELIDGVDYLLDRVDTSGDTSGDFFPVSIDGAPAIDECNGPNGCHPVDPAPVPEPGTLMLFAPALIGLAGLRRRMFKRPA